MMDDLTKIGSDTARKLVEKADWNATVRSNYFTNLLESCQVPSFSERDRWKFLCISLDTTLGLSEDPDAAASVETHSAERSLLQPTVNLTGLRPIPTRHAVAGLGRRAPVGGI
jgi:hypothetical protein